MKFASSLFLLLAAILLPANLLAEENQYSCSTDENGKAVVLDSAKPGKELTVKKAKSSLKKKKGNLTDQKEAVKASSLSKTKKEAKLAALKLKLSEIKSALNIVSGCQDGSPGGGEIRTQIVVNYAFCNGDPKNNCEFRGFLRVKNGDSSTCASNRTITITKDNTTVLGTTNTDASTPIGGWNIDGVNLGMGNYHVVLSELIVGDTKCAGALSIWSIDSTREGKFVSEQY